MAPVVLRTCPFPFREPTHGGIHRSEQVRELLVEGGVEVVEREDVAPPLRPLSDRLRGAVRAVAGGDVRAFRARQLGSLGHLARSYRAALGARAYDAVVWETTGEGVTPRVAAAYGVPVVAVPHQLEAFFTAHFEGVRRARVFDLLRREVDALSRAAHVFAISAEDAVLLRNHGVEADYLPYHPPRRLRDLLLAVRARRRETPKAYHLVLGSVHNHATRDGVVELAAWIDRVSAGAAPRVRLAGNGTEALREAFRAYPWLEVEGRVDPPALDTLMAGARAVLVHQRQGFGVLTRIPEALVAGVPVVANRVAARSAAHLDGVAVYDDPEELQAWLRADLPDPAAPPAPVRASARFVRAVTGQAA